MNNFADDGERGGERRKEREREWRKEKGERERVEKGRNKLTLICLKKR
jgi:hypothetical protein